MGAIFIFFLVINGLLVGGAFYGWHENPYAYLSLDVGAVAWALAALPIGFLGVSFKRKLLIELAIVIASEMVGVGLYAIYGEPYKYYNHWQNWRFYLVFPLIVFGCGAVGVSLPHILRIAFRVLKPKFNP